MLKCIFSDLDKVTQIDQERLLFLDTLLFIFIFISPELKADMSGLSGLTNNPEAELWFIISLLGLKPKTNLLWRYLILARALTEVTAISIHPISKTLNIVYGSEFWQIFLGELTSSTSSM